MNGNGKRLDLIGLATSKGGWVAGLALSLTGLADIVLEFVPASTTRSQLVIRAGARIVGGFAVVALALKMKNNSDTNMAVKAEERIADPRIASASTVPALQKAIDEKLMDPRISELSPTASARATPLLGTPSPKE